MREEGVPIDLAVVSGFLVRRSALREGGSRIVAAQYDDVLDGMGRELQRLVDDRFQRDVLPLTVGHVCGDDEARSAGDDAIAQRPRAEAGEHHRVNGANADDRQHQRDGFWARRHINGDAVALLDAERAECGGDTLNVLQETVYVNRR